MKSLEPTAAHLAFMNDLKGAIARHTNLNAQEMLAVTAQLVGNLIALQDQRTMTPEMPMAVVSENIEVGNRVAVEGLLNTKGTA